MRWVVGPALPVEVRACALLMGGGAVVFVLLGAVRLAVEGGAGVLWIPVAVACFALTAVVGLLAAVRPARMAALAVSAVIALMLMLIVLGPGPWWARLVSGVLAAGYSYAFVLLNTAPVRRYVGGAR